MVLFFPRKNINKVLFLCVCRGLFKLLSRSKSDKHARAYIKFKSPEALIAFYKGVNKHLFADEKSDGVTFSLFAWLNMIR